jgi:type IV pilus assembly protein PilQ
MRNIMNRHSVLTTLLSLAPLSAAAPAWAAPANIISGIEVQDGDPARLIIHGSQEPTFTVFRLGQPPRVVVDLANADLSHVKTPAESRSAEAPITTVTTTQFKDPAHPIGRVVIALGKDTPFDVKAEGHNVVVTLTPAAKKPGPLAQGAPPAEPSTQEAPAIVLEQPAPQTATQLLGVSGESRPGGGAVVRLKTNGPVERYEVQEVANPTRLVVDLFGITQAPKNAPALKKGPLSRVRLGKHDTHVRVVVDARSDVLPHFDVVSTEDGVLVAFAAKSADVTPATAQPAPQVTVATTQDAAAPAPQGGCRTPAPGQDPGRQV